MHNSRGQSKYWHALQAYASKCKQYIVIQCVCLIWSSDSTCGMVRGIYGCHIWASYHKSTKRYIYLLVLEKNLIPWPKKRKKMHLRAGWAIPSTATSFTSMATTVSQTLTFSFTRQFLVARHLMQTCKASHEHEGLRTCILLTNSIEVYICSYRPTAFSVRVRMFAQPDNLLAKTHGNKKWGSTTCCCARSYLHIRVKSTTTQTNLKHRGLQTSNIGILILKKYVSHVQIPKHYLLMYALWESIANSVSKLSLDNQIIPLFDLSTYMDWSIINVLDKTVPPSSDPHNGRPLWSQDGKSHHMDHDGTALGTCVVHTQAPSHMSIHMWQPLHHTPTLDNPSSHTGKCDDLGVGIPHTCPHGTLSHTYAFRNLTSHHTPSCTGKSFESTISPPLSLHTHICDSPALHTVGRGHHGNPLDSGGVHS